MLAMEKGQRLGPRAVTGAEADAVRDALTDAEADSVKDAVTDTSNRPVARLSEPRMKGALQTASRWRRRFLVGVAAVVLVIVGLVAGLRLGWGSWSTEEVRTAIVSTLQSESPESILVTGSIEVGVTTVSSNTRYLLPGVVPLDLGTTEAVVRVPGRVTYGIDVSELGPERIRLVDGVLYVSIPEIHIIGVEPDLDELELQTRVGWARTHAGSGADATREAIGKITNAMREQAERHIEDAIQPRINTAHAILDVVSRALHAAGIEVRDVRVEVAPGIVVEQPQG